MDVKKKFRIGYWNVGIINSSIEEVMNTRTYSISWMKHRYNDRFFADPFLFYHDDNNYYIFAEELKFVKNKGTIVLLTVNKKNMKLVKRIEVINDKFHLSYPNYIDNAIVAENYKSGGLYKFYINESSKKKELILDIPLIDPTFVKYKGKEWLFATTKEHEDDPNKKLSIFYKEGERYYPHKDNPVVDDIHTARPGGHFFVYEGELYRPAQNSEHIYGEDIRIMRVIELNEKKYVEEEVMTISSHNCNRFNLGLHTFNTEDGFIIVDGFEYRYNIYQKMKIKFARLIQLFIR